MIAMCSYNFHWCGGRDSAVWWTAQRSAADHNNFLVYQSYLLQLQWVCLARAVSELGNLKLKTLGRKKGKESKKNWKRERKNRFRYQQEMERERDMYTEGDIRGCTNKGGAALAADCGGVPMKRRHSPGCMPPSCLLSPSAACYTSVPPNGRKKTMFQQLC